MNDQPMRDSVFLPTMPKIGGEDSTNVCQEKDGEGTGVKDRKINQILYSEANLAADL